MHLKLLRLVIFNNSLSFWKKSYSHAKSVRKMPGHLDVQTASKRSSFLLVNWEIVSWISFSTGLPVKKGLRSTTVLPESVFTINLTKTVTCNFQGLFFSPSNYVLQIGIDNVSNIGRVIHDEKKRIAKEMRKTNAFTHEYYVMHPYKHKQILCKHKPLADHWKWKNKIYGKNMNIVGFFWINFKQPPSNKQLSLLTKTHVMNVKCSLSNSLVYWFLFFNVFTQFSFTSKCD